MSLLIRVRHRIVDESQVSGELGSSAGGRRPRTEVSEGPDIVGGPEQRIRRPTSEYPIVIACTMATGCGCASYRDPSLQPGSYLSKKWARYYDAVPELDIPPLR